jgi:hypothetical protein
LEEEQSEYFSKYLEREPAIALAAIIQALSHLNLVASEGATARRETPRTTLGSGSSRLGAAKSRSAARWRAPGDNYCRICHRGRFHATADSQFIQLNKTTININHIYENPVISPFHEQLTIIKK